MTLRIMLTNGSINILIFLCWQFVLVHVKVVSDYQFVEPPLSPTYEVGSAEDGSIVVHVNPPNRAPYVEPPPRPKYIIESVEDGSFRVHVNNPFIELKPVKPVRQTVNPRLLLREQQKNSQYRVSNKSRSPWANSLENFYQRPTLTTPRPVLNRETSPTVTVTGRHSVTNDADIDYPSYGLPYSRPNKAPLGGMPSVSSPMSVFLNNNPSRALNTSPNASAVAEQHSEGMRIAFEDYTPVNSGGHNEVIDGKHMDASDGAVFNEVSDDDDYGGGYSSSKVPTVVHPSLTAVPHFASASSDNSLGDYEASDQINAGKDYVLRVRGGYEPPKNEAHALTSSSASDLRSNGVVSPALIRNSSSLRSSRPNPMAIAPSARNMPSGVSASSSTEDRDLLYKSANMIPSSLSGLPRVAGSTYTFQSMRRPVNNRPASTRASIRDFNHGQGQHSPADLGFPLPECYRTATGHMCCNRLLEELIYASASEMIRANTNKCNIHQFSLVLANRAEREFQTSFEVIVGVGDFAAKAHFKDNLICKTIVNNKFVLIYATAEEYPIDMTNYVPPISGLIKA